MWRFILNVLDLSTWGYRYHWLRDNPIVIPFIVAYFLPYFFIINLSNYFLRIFPKEGVSTIVVIVALILWTVIFIVIVIKLAFYIEDKKEK